MKIRTTLLSGSGLLLLATVPAAHAHVTFVDATAEAGRSFIAVANINHGCEDELGNYDTYKVEIELPAGITARPMSSPVGQASVDDSGDPVKLVWERDSSDVGADDALFYQVSFRFTAPNTPLASLQFRTTQSCAGSTQIVWEGVDAPTLRIVPTHATGWNKYTAQADISLEDIAATFADAQIVWAGSQAYSANPVIADLIQNPLTVITAGTEYWVKY
ncbi:MAG: DUF1775 domain-containing protein [Gammaproteobacteria bacterium]|nr:DUF1775 domain-containing protein [Gammaproteobacteria bacterium]